jgi:hypothetical protein
MFGLLKSHRNFSPHPEQPVGQPVSFRPFLGEGFVALRSHQLPHLCGSGTVLLQVVE